MNILVERLQCLFLEMTVDSYLSISFAYNSFIYVGEADGVRGLKSLGVRELTYRLAFLACSVASTNPQFGGKDLVSEDVTAEVIKKQMTEQEWYKIYEMSQDKNLYHNLVSSMFPAIHGKLTFHGFT